jgi:uncharacterized heparinase superfamily protein
MNAKNFFRLYHTVKYLRWEQIVYRLLYKFYTPKPSAKVQCDYEVNSFCFHNNDFFESSLVGDDQFLFLGEKHTVSRKSDWNSEKVSKLWLYNLHYFDDLNAKANELRVSQHQSLLYRWIEENPACAGNGWEPYPLSLRLVNLVKWCSRQSNKDPKILQSMLLQADVLSKKLEYHILGNHLFANAKALTFVGVFFKDSLLAQRYLKQGLKILSREVSEQFLNDGGHFELSPMYHQILLLDLLELIELARLSNNSDLLRFSKKWEPIAVKSLNWLKSMCHPDKEICFFNDAAMGIAAKPEDLLQYGERLSLIADSNISKLLTHKNSGYTRISYVKHTVFFDHAEIGPRYLPGHAHADSLSVEWSVGNQRVLVNSGTSLYGESAERLRQRKTAAHNTVVVDDEDSSEVWSGFRVARRARITEFTAGFFLDNVVVSAKHDGYKRFGRDVIHSRSLDVSEDSLIIGDDLQGGYTSAYASFHFHPDISILQTADDSLILTLPCLLKITVISSSPIKLFDTTWHPLFGTSIPIQKALIQFNAHSVLTQFSIVSGDSV